jgi:hypothetical protein
MKKKLNLLLVIAIIALSSCKKDDGDKTPITPAVVTTFCYNYLGNSTPYDTLQGGTSINRVNSDGFYEVDLGFSFSLCDSSFSKLYIESDYLSTTFTYKISSNITDVRKYYIIAHGDLDLQPKWDNGTGNYLSKIITTTTGSIGNKITKLEFREFEYEDFVSGSLSTVNYMIIFKETDNSVTYHYGPNDLTTNFKNDPFNQFVIGLYSNNELDGLFLEGDPNLPTTNINGLTSQLNTWPLEGTFYKFTEN